MAILKECFGTGLDSLFFERTRADEIFDFDLKKFQDK